MRNARTLNHAYAIRPNTNVVLVITGLLLSTLGAFGYEHSASLFDLAALPIFPGLALVLAVAYRTGFIRL